MEKFSRIHSLFSGKRLQIISLLFVLALGCRQVSAINYYSFTNGDWGVAGTWTTDPTGLTSVGAAVPGAADNIFIINGRTVTTSVSRTVAGASIANLGVLDLGTSTGHNLGNVSGTGTLVISSGSFPGGNFTSFVSLSGGVVEYRNVNGVLPAQLTFNRLVISNTSASAITSQLPAPTNPANYLINSSITLNATGSGSLQFNLGTVAGNIINLSVKQDVTVSANTTFGVSSINAIHNINVEGNFLNSGTVQFSNAPQFSASTTGAANLTFSGSVNCIFSVNGTTNVYTLIVDKGVDFNSELEVSGTNSSFFNFFSNADALTLVNGTLKWSGGMSQTRINAGGIFTIPFTSRLWINGGDMLLNGSVGGVLVEGIFRISNGNFSSGNEGLILGLNGAIFIQGGSSTVEKLRPNAVAGNHFGSLNISGGTLNVDGSTLGFGDLGSPRFSIPYPNMAFFMTGGVLNVAEPEAGAAVNGGIYIGVNATNAGISAGDINVSFSGSGANFNISSTASFFNLTVNKNGFGAAALTLGTQVFGPAYNQTYFSSPASASSLNVRRNFTLSSGGGLEFIANGFDLIVGRNFTISNGTTYTPGNNTTTFNGSGSQQFINGGTITAGLFNLTITKTPGQSLLMGGSATTYTVLNTLTVNSGSFNSGGKQILCQGNLVVSSSCLGTGSIQLVGTGAQIISGSNSGIFTNLTLNKPSGSTTMTANFQISGILRLANAAAVLDIGNKVLFFTAASRIYDALTGTNATNFSATRMIRTNGAFSDGGIRKNYNNANRTFLYPYGVTGKYTPATMTITGNPTAFGFILSRPVNERHPVATADEAIPYYWRTNSTGFVLGSATCTQQYSYADADVFLIAPATEADYVPAKFAAATVEWIVGPATDVNEATNTINITPSTFGGTIDGEYTCGAQIPEDPFSLIITFYSIRNGVWEDIDELTTPWSVRSHTGDPTTATPGSRNPVLIGDGASFQHTITSGADGERAGYLFIGQGSVFDLSNTRQHDFSIASGLGISGTGLMRISSSLSTAEFPGGDFGVFLSAVGGSIEYYSTSTSFTLPSTSGAPDLIPLITYNNLTIAPTTGSIITLPDLDLSVLKTFRINGSPTPAAGFVRHNNSNARQLTIGGSFLIDAGELQFQNGVAQNVIANSNLIISNGGSYRVSGSGSVVNNSLTLRANLTNNGIFDMNESGRSCTTTFTGNSDRQVGGTNASAVTEFGGLTIDKGPALEKTIEITVAGSFSAPSNDWLQMVNGGLRISRPVSLTLTNTNIPFNLPSNTQLTLNHPSAEILIGQTASDVADFVIGGKLVMINGSLTVGISGTNNNQDIEYTPGVSPEIDLRNNSTLYVNGQLRRSLGTNNGTLTYKQSGNSVLEIGGVNANTTRAKFEVLNTGSIFNFSDNANIIIRRGGATPFADVFLQPGASSITGGTFSFITNNINVDQEFFLESSVGLPSVLVDGFDANDQASVKIFSSPLTINGNLTINDDHSSFDANGIALNLNGNLVNNNSSSSSSLNSGGFRPSTSSQLTQFSSSTGNQSITGVGGNLTNFSNLSISNSAPSGVVSLGASSNIQVNSTLSIITGTLNDGGNTINCKSDILNNSIHQTTASGSITCSGTSAQTISGNGTGVFGKLVVNNSSNVNTNATVTINNNLDLQAGLFHIAFNLLKLNTNCTVSGTFSSSSMIRTNGNAGDSGVMKMFPPTAAAFEFPVGTSGVYTPANYNITSNSASGSIRLVPVASKHPATTLAADEQLNYYWIARSSGFSGLSVNHRYQYNDAQVLGTEANYVTGRFVLPQWTPIGGLAGTVNTSTNRMELSGVNFLSGEFTCGDPLEFQQIDTLFSRDVTLGGAWDDPNTWSSVSHSGPPAGVIPTFQILSVKNGHTVNTNGNNRNCSVMINNGVVDTEDDSNITFGFCEGNGRLRITSNGSAFVFPFGDFNAFHASSGGTVEYYGSVDGILSPSPFYNNLEFTGNSVKTMGSLPFTVNGNLLLSSGTFDASIFNQDISLGGDWVNNSGAASFLPGQGKVVFIGTNQNVGGTATTTFYNAEFANAGTKTLANNLIINNDLFINPGVTLDVSTSNFNIQLKHDWVNNGTFNARQGTVDLNGGSLQTLTGNSVTEFFNLNQNNIFDVSLGSDQSVKNALTITSGDFNTTPRKLNLLSDLTRTGRIAPLLSGDFLGTINQQRLVPGPTTGWAMIGAPVSGQFISQWTDDFATSGFVGSSGSAGNFISMFTYDEPDLGGFGDPTSYNAITNAGVDQIIPGQGYWTFLGTALNTTSDILVDAEGPIVKGSFNFNPSFTSSGSITDDGWNLVANPYPSAIDWDASSGWTKIAMDNAIYIYNADGAQYSAWVSGVSVNGGVPFIGSSQGFYVKANAAGARLACSESVKSSANPTFLRQGRSSTDAVSDMFRMTLRGNGKADEAVVRFHPDATSKYDGSFDAYKWDATTNTIASVSTISEDLNLSINSLPQDFSSLSIPVKVLAGLEADYELSFQGIESLSGISCLVIEDLETGRITDLKSSDKLVFHSQVGRVEPRFLIHLEKDVEAISSAASCENVQDGSLTFSGLAGRKVTVLSENGVEVAVIEGKSDFTLDHLGSGVYQIVSRGSLCGEMSKDVTVPARVQSGAKPSYTISEDGTYAFVIPTSSEAEVIWNIEGQSYYGSAQSHSFTSNGDYEVSVIVREGQCVEKHLMPLSVASIHMNGDFKVIRDANGNHQLVVSGYDGDLGIEVLNASGQMVSLTTKVSVGSGSRVDLRTSELSEGVYLLRVNTSEGIFIRKLHR